MASPAFIQPCSPTTASKPPTGERWTHEVEWDGFRFQVIKAGREVRLFSRNGVDWTERLPAIAEALARLPARVAQIDGELCLCDTHGRPDFRALMRAARQRPADETGLSFHAFDLLQLNAADLKPKPLVERRKRLVDMVQALEEAVPALYLPDQFAGGSELLAMWGKMHLEGIVSKRLDRPYVSGPTKDWLKVKCPAWKEANRWRAEAFAKRNDKLSSRVAGERRSSATPPGRARRRECVSAIAPIEARGMKVVTRIEFAAALLASACDHAYVSGEEESKGDGPKLFALTEELVLRRAREIYAQGHGRPYTRPMH